LRQPKKRKNKREKDRVSLYIADHHIPFIDRRADELVIKVIETLLPDELILGGDVVDFWQISKFNNNPLARVKLDGPRTIQDDANDVYDYLVKVRNIIGKSAQLVFLEGNHEERLRAWVDRYPEISGVKALEPEELFKISKVGVDKYITYKPRDWYGASTPEEDHWIIPNKLIAVHGYRYSVNAGYVCNHMIRDYGCSGISSHNHKSGSSSRQLKREQVAWWEVGCLCKIYPNYRKHANWQQGFGVVYSNPKDPDDFDVSNIRITPNYTCRVNGIKFTRRGPQ